jgi:hypothetical protein
MGVQIPFAAHGRCYTALICLTGMPKRAYHYSKTIGQEESWALRDYLTGEILRFADSGKTASQVEDLVTYAAATQYRSVGVESAWKKDCQAVSEQHFGSAHVDMASRNSDLGNWRRMNQRGM